MEWKWKYGENKIILQSYFVVDTKNPKIIAWDIRRRLRSCECVCASEDGRKIHLKRTGDSKREKMEREGARMNVCVCVVGRRVDCSIDIDGSLTSKPTTRLIQLSKHLWIGSAPAVRSILHFRSLDLCTCSTFTPMIPPTLTHTPHLTSPFSNPITHYCY